jgi:hypothetical protein
MKRLSILCITLVLLGLFSHPGCDDESNDSDKLLLLLLWQSQKYYLSFDTDDGPVRMRVSRHFKYYSSEDRYLADFTGDGDEAYIDLPPDVPASEPYDQSTPDFRFSYDRDGTDYGTYPSHSFTFDIISGGIPGGEITAIFSGVISDNGLPEYTINITNGELSARITN